MTITIKEARKHLIEKKHIVLEYATRFLDVKIGKRPLGEAVVGIKDDVLYIVHKEFLKGYVISAYKLDIDNISTVTGWNIFKIMINAKTIELELKKVKVSLSDPIEGDFEYLIKSLDFSNEVQAEKQINRTKGYYYTKKALKYGKYATAILTGMVVTDLAVDLAVEFLEERIKETVTQTIVENSDMIAEKSAKKVKKSFLDIFSI